MKRRRGGLGERLRGEERRAGLGGREGRRGEEGWEREGRRGAYTEHEKHLPNELAWFQERKRERRVEGEGGRMREMSLRWRDTGYGVFCEGE